LEQASSRFASGEELVEALGKRHEAQVDIPAPLRLFIDWRKNLPLTVPTIAAAWGLTFLVTDADHPALHFMAMILVLLGIGAPLALLLGRIRRLAQLGYGAQDVAAALRKSADRRREEFFYEHGAREDRGDRLLRVSSNVMTVLAAGAGIVMFAPLGGMPPSIAQVLGRLRDTWPFVLGPLFG